MFRFLDIIQPVEWMHSVLVIDKLLEGDGLVWDIDYHVDHGELHNLIFLVHALHAGMT